MSKQDLSPAASSNELPLQVSAGDSAIPQMPKKSQFQKGLENIRIALTTAIHDRGVSGAALDCKEVASGDADAMVTVTQGNKVESQGFNRVEIEDCGEAVSAPVALKVRMLVSHFIG